MAANLSACLRRVRMIEGGFGNDLADHGVTFNLGALRPCPRMGVAGR